MSLKNVDLNLILFEKRNRRAIPTKYDAFDYRLPKSLDIPKTGKSSCCNNLNKQKLEKNKNKKKITKTHQDTTRPTKKCSLPSKKSSILDKNEDSLKKSINNKKKKSALKKNICRPTIKKQKNNKNLKRIQNNLILNFCREVEKFSVIKVQNAPSTFKITGKTLEKLQHKEHSERLLVFTSLDFQDMACIENKNCSDLKRACLDYQPIVLVSKLDNERIEAEAIAPNMSSIFASELSHQRVWTQDYPQYVSSPGCSFWLKSSSYEEEFDSIIKPEPQPDSSCDEGNIDGTDEVVNAMEGMDEIEIEEDVKWFDDPRYGV